MSPQFLQVGLSPLFQIVAYFKLKTKISFNVHWAIHRCVVKDKIIYETDPWRRFRADHTACAMLTLQLFPFLFERRFARAEAVSKARRDGPCNRSSRGCVVHAQAAARSRWGRTQSGPADGSCSLLCSCRVLCSVHTYEKMLGLSSACCSFGLQSFISFVQRTGSHSVPGITVLNHYAPTLASC